ncbi:MAG: YggT family protein [Gammaproteobacteria bacterium]|nr:YggT family protein [Gammaproteobacteria bacterium]MCP5136404.1 YggT family protein [Gammaproteobacteria bacterium]
MGGDYYTSPIEFLINTLGGLYVAAVMLRFLFQLSRADFYNPISQFIVKITNPLLVPLRRVIPSVGGIDTASLVLLMLLQMAIFAIVLLLRGGIPTPGVLLIAALIELLQLLINIYFWAILIQAILSWVQPGQYNPASSLLFQLTSPLLAPARRLLPPISGLDLSPLIVIMGLKLAEMILLPPLARLMM